RAGQRPHWLTDKLIPAVDGPVPVVHQVVHTWAESFEMGPIWAAEGELSFADAPHDELAGLAPREIMRAEYWSELKLTVGYGKVLADLKARGM
ncbi:MAG: acetoacetate decarboxylase family protein, partial [Deltaproteobacteria bacterium]|nr:acetoacetate decarboxylase family protein [Deltaproteobacteria bacterium]